MFGNLFSNFGKVSDAGTSVVVDTATYTAKGVKIGGGAAIDGLKIMALEAKKELYSSVIEFEAYKKDLCEVNNVTLESIEATLEAQFPTGNPVVAPLSVKQMQQQLKVARKAAKEAEEAAKQ